MNNRPPPEYDELIKAKKQADKIGSVLYALFFIFIYWLGTQQSILGFAVMVLFYTITLLKGK